MICVSRAIKRPIISYEFIGIPKVIVVDISYYPVIDYITNSSHFALQPARCEHVQYLYRI